MVRKLAVLAFLQVVCSLTSCNTCDPLEGGSGNTGYEDRVFFTSFPLNSLVPSIYSLNSKGKDIRLHASNGTLFSAPSEDGKIAFLRYDSKKGKNVIMLSKLDKADSMRIDEDNPDYSVAEPILSPDGNKIAFNGGNKRLFIWVNTSSGASYIDKVSNDMYDNTMASFSPDASKIAFFEGSKDDGTLKLKILNSEMPDITIFERSFEDVNKETALGLEIFWSADSRKVSFLLSEDSTQKLLVLELGGGETYFVLDPFNSESCAPSPDLSYLIFTNAEGEVWGRNINSSEVKYSPISGEDHSSFNLFYLWNILGHKLIFNKFYKDDGFSNISTLYLVDVQINNDLMEIKNQTILSNNAYKGFWGRKLK